MDEDQHEFPDRHEDPQPGRLLGGTPVPREPHEGHHRERAEVVDEGVDLFGAEDAAALLVERLEQVQPGSPEVADDGRRVLSPAFSTDRDRIDGFPSAPSTLVVFGAFGTPWSRRLGELLTSVRRRHETTVRVAWRHYPDPAAHPRAAILALAAEAGASLHAFWPIAHELLRLRHDDPRDLRSALLHAGADPRHALDAMRAGTGADRIAEDVASALSSGVTVAPTLFVNGEQYDGELDAVAVSAALDATG
jgi:protein-disulfide isomerase